jgi:transposase-like protein
LGLAFQGRYTTPGEAARRVGIGKSTLWRWIRAGQRGDPRFACLVKRMAEIQKNWLDWL